MVFGLWLLVFELGLWFLVLISLCLVLVQHRNPSSKPAGYEVEQRTKNKVLSAKNKDQSPKAKDQLVAKIRLDHFGIVLDLFRQTECD